MKEIKQYNIDNINIIGIAHIPESNAKMLGVVLLCPGHQYRVGPHRMYVKLARVLTKNGYHVLRVDAEGIGDSNGEFTDQMIHEVHGRIQRGCFLKNSKKIIQQFRKEYCLKNIIVSGLCGASLTGLLASKTCKEIDGLIGFGLPFLYADVPNRIEKQTTLSKNSYQKENGDKQSAKTDKDELVINDYLKKLISINFWKRAISMQTDFRLLSRTLWHGLQRMILKRNPAVNYKAINAINDLFNTKKNFFLIYSGNDFHYKNFQFVLNHNSLLKKKFIMHKNSLAVIENANHTMTNPEWEFEFHDLFVGWINSVSNVYDEEKLSKTEV